MFSLTMLDLDELLGRATGLELTENDVVFGRGGFTNRHPGNIEYLKLLGEHEEAYMDCKRKYQKLLSLCIVHQLRCKGVRFLKKDQKSGSWKTVQLTQCRLKISQRLRERAPFIKLEQLNAKRGLAKLIRAPAPSSVVHAPPVEMITVTDASSDEEDDTESIGFDEISATASNDGVSLRRTLERFLGDCDQLDSWAEEQFQQEDQGKRTALFCGEEPQPKRLRTVSMDDQDYANMLLTDASLLEDISVASLSDPFEQETGDFQSEGMGQFDNFECAAAGSEDEVLEYLQVLF